MIGDFTNMKSAIADGVGSLLRVSPLCLQRADAAYPLMHSALPQLTLDEWRRYVAALDGPAEDPSRAPGIMVATAQNGVLRGAYVYGFETRWGDGPSLVVRHLVVRHVAIPLLGQEMAVRSLATSMQNLARSRDCHAIVVVLPPDAAWEIDYFRKLGCEVSILDTARTLAAVAT